jgi:uncharacterized OB-fold protein
MSYAKPLPVPDADSRPFWEGCHHHKLLIMRCNRCGQVRFPPTTFCSRCQAHEHLWIESTGRGRVFSWIVVRHPVPQEVYAEDVPYIVAVVELEEGVRIPSNIIDCTPELVRAGLPVHVVFRDVNDQISLPVFRPDPR